MGSVLHLHTTHVMASSLLVRSLLVVALAGISLQQVTRAPVAPQWATTGFPGFPGYQGTGQGFRQGNQGYRGVQGYPGSNGMYGFEIVDAPDRYGYVSNYPGGRTSFFLLGPNRGPGQQSWRGSNVVGGGGGGGLQASYRPAASTLGTAAGPGAGGWRQPGAW